jgi:hypothetical protein
MTSLGSNGTANRPTLKSSANMEGGDRRGQFQLEIPTSFVSMLWRSVCVRSLGGALSMSNFVASEADVAGGTAAPGSEKVVGAQVRARYPLSCVGVPTLKIAVTDGVVRQ